MQKGKNGQKAEHTDQVGQDGMQCQAAVLIDQTDLLMMVLQRMSQRRENMELSCSARVLIPNHEEYARGIGAEPVL